MFRSYARSGEGTLCRLIGVIALFACFANRVPILGFGLLFFFWVWGGYLKYQSRNSVRIIRE